MAFKRIILAIVLSVAAQCVWAHRLTNLDIKVDMQADGTAVITEQRTMDVTDEGTECYIPISNLGKMQISDFVVSEGELAYSQIGAWDTDASRAEKANKCGIVTTDDGYELCWGLGDSGEHVYTVTYKLSGLVQRYSDADGFVHMFVNPGMKPAPENLRLTFSSSAGPFNKKNSKAWAFGFEGNVRFYDGKVMVTSSDALDDGKRVIVMMQFDKSLFDPAIEGEGTFAERKEKAMEGSDYEEKLDPLQRFTASVGKLIGVDRDTAGLILMAVLGVLAFLMYRFWHWFVYIFTLKPLRRKMRLKKFIGSRESLDWNRNLPYDDSLVKSNQVLNAFSTKAKPDFGGVVGAIILRLIYKKSITIDPLTKKLCIGEYTPEGSPEADMPAEIDIYNILKEAAGENSLLDEGELKSWVEQHKESGIASLEMMRRTADSTELDKEEVSKLYGLKKFLEDFTLINERGAVEVQLWNEYLVFATLFGIADQVMADFKRICPEYFKLSAVGQVVVENVATISTFHVLLSSYYYSSFMAFRRRTSMLRNSGLGGASSLLGGGGFSGGGSGGGTR